MTNQDRWDAGERDYKAERDAADQQAYDHGYHSCGDGVRMSENPFHPGKQPDEYDAWKMGWRNRNMRESSLDESPRDAIIHIGVTAGIDEHAGQYLITAESLDGYTILAVYDTLAAARAALPRIKRAALGQPAQVHR